MVRIGCSGWNYDSWRGALYPEKMGKARWLGEYGTHFDTVEVNSTFYGTASRKAVDRWVAATPERFSFTVKASRYLTHVKRLRDHPDKGFELAEGIKRFYEPLGPLVTAGKLGPTLWQLPANFKRDDGRLRDLLELAPPGRHALEFRDKSWFCDDVYGLLRDHDAALVLADDPERPLPTPSRSAAGPSSASTAARAAGAATTRRPRSRRGPSGSPAGATPAPTSTPTSTTTGRPSPRATRSCCDGCSPARAASRPRPRPSTARAAPRRRRRRASPAPRRRPAPRRQARRR